MGEYDCQRVVFIVKPLSVKGAFSNLEMFVSFLAPFASWREKINEYALLHSEIISNL